MCLVGVVVRRYIDFLILLIPLLLLYLLFFAAGSLLLVKFLNVFFHVPVLFVIKFYVLNIFSLSINTDTGNYGRPTAAI